VPGSPAGTATQEEFVEEQLETGVPTARPVMGMRRRWAVTYEDIDGSVRTLPVEARTSKGARKVLAAYDSDVRVLKVAQMEEEMPPPDMGPEMDMDMEMGPEADMGGMPGEEPMAPGMSVEVPPEVAEAINAAMLTFRNTGVDIASGIKDFQTQFKKVLERFGDEMSPGRQRIGAEIVRAAQDAWSKPALIDLTASRRRADKPPPGADMDPSVNETQGDYVQLPDAEALLDEDSATDDSVTDAVEPSGKIETQPSTPQPASGGLSPTDMGGGEEDKDPKDFGAGKPPKDGETTKVENMEGATTPPTDLGHDSMTGDNPVTDGWEHESDQAYGNIRSK
jgi:hypothetical protein